MAGWGSGTWGGSPWGGIVPAPPVTGALLFVKSVDLRRVLVQFVASVDPVLLYAFPYTFTPQSVPAYTPVVKSARFINGPGIIENSLVELYLDNDMSPGVSYQLVITV